MWGNQDRNPAGKKTAGEPENAQDAPGLLNRSVSSATSLPRRLGGGGLLLVQSPLLKPHRLLMPLVTPPPRLIPRLPFWHCGFCQPVLNGSDLPASPDLRSRSPNPHHSRSPAGWDPHCAAPAGAAPPPRRSCALVPARRPRFPHPGLLLTASRSRSLRRAGGAGCSTPGATAGRARLRLLPGARAGEGPVGLGVRQAALIRGATDPGRRHKKKSVTRLCAIAR